LRSGIEASSLEDPAIGGGFCELAGLQQQHWHKLVALATNKATGKIVASRCSQP
jgi:hypothetical protein